MRLHATVSKDSRVRGVASILRDALRSPSGDRNAPQDEVGIFVTIGFAAKLHKLPGALWSLLRIDGACGGHRCFERHAARRNLCSVLYQSSRPHEQSYAKRTKPQWRHTNLYMARSPPGW